MKDQGESALLSLNRSGTLTPPSASAIGNKVTAADPGSIHSLSGIWISVINDSLYADESWRFRPLDARKGRYHSLDP